MGPDVILGAKDDAGIVSIATDKTITVMAW